ncbi:hypothetical protein [Streptomyces sp. CA-106131]|uniref:hypothetical protein n=1 Tax=Streptomyces sp. CA-106131 TaxID=3240045 RepID=UPI003D933576
MTYVTVEEFTAFLAPDPLPDNAARLLKRVSTTIDKLLVGTVYKTDQDGLPVDPDLLSAIKDCVCMQAQYLTALQDETGAMRNVSKMSMGNQLLARTFSLSKDGTSRICPDVLDLLQVSGLHPINPLLWG